MIGMSTSYSVGQVAHLAGVTVRTLRHYDEIGLLTPTERSPGGYRLYSDAGSRTSAADSVLPRTRLSVGRHRDHPRRPACGRGRAPAPPAPPARERIARLRRCRARREGNGGTTDGDLAYPRGTVRGVRHRQGRRRVGRAEAEQRWGDTDAYRESQQRAAAYSKEDWMRLKAEADEGLRRVRRGPAVGRARGQLSRDGSRRGPSRVHRAAGSTTAATTSPWPRPDVHRRREVQQALRRRRTRTRAIHARRDHRQRRPALIPPTALLPVEWCVRV